MSLSIGNNFFNNTLEKTSSKNKVISNDNKPVSSIDNSKEISVTHDKKSFLEVKKGINLETSHKAKKFSFPTPQSTRVTTSLGKKIEALAEIKNIRTPNKIEEKTNNYEQAKNITFDIRKATSIKIPEKLEVKAKTQLGNQVQQLTEKPKEALENIKDGVTKVALKIKDADRGTKYVKALVDSDNIGSIDKKIKEKLDGKVSVFSKIGNLFQEAEKSTKELTKLENEIESVHKSAGGATTKDALALVDGKIDLLKETNKKSKEYIERLDKELSIMKSIGTETPQIRAFEGKLNELKKSYEKANEAYKKLETEKNSFKKFGKAGAVAGLAAQTVTTVLSVKKAKEILTNSKTTFKEGMMAMADVAVDVTKNVGQVAGIFDKFKSIPVAKKVSATLAAAGSLYDATKSWGKGTDALSKKLDKTAMALLDTTASISSFAAETKHIAVGVASKFGKYAAKFAPVEAAVASKFGYGIFAVVSVRKAYETSKNPNASPQEKRAALINAGLDVATGVAMLAGATTVGHVVLGAKIAYELYNFADERYHITEKAGKALNKAGEAISNKASEISSNISQKATEAKNQVSKSFSDAKEKASSWVSSFFNKPKLQTS